MPDNHADRSGDPGFEHRRFFTLPAADASDHDIDAFAHAVWETLAAGHQRQQNETELGDTLTTPSHSHTFIDAFVLAAELHVTQRRKSTEIPYIAHLMTVASIIFEAGGTETQAIAGLLHDAVEDQGGIPTLQRIEAQFGPAVARIVKACSDAAPAPGEDKAPWRERKEHHLALLANEDAEVLLVTVCDKIHNGESILHDLDVDGAKIWDRFNASPSDITWYYTSVLRIAERGLDNAYAVGRLRALVARLASAAVAAPLSNAERTAWGIPTQDVDE